MPLRNNILLQKLAQPTRVTLPNGGTFLPPYERVNRASLTLSNKCQNKKNLYAKNRSKKTKKTEKKTAAKRK